MKINDPKRFLKPVIRCKIQNFAVENLGKNKNIAEEKNNVSEGVRDTFAQVLAIQSVTASQCDLRFLSSYPITDVQTECRQTECRQTKYRQT